MKKLSRNEMKKVMGGDAPGAGCPTGYAHGTVQCMDGYTMPSTNLCAQSWNLCNAHGGFQACYCWN